MTQDQRWAALHSRSCKVSCRSADTVTPNFMNYVDCFQQQSRNSSHQHVRGLKRPTRASVAEEALDNWHLDTEAVSVVPSESSSTKLAKFNTELANFESLGKIAEAFATCHAMKQEGIRPNRTTYDHLLSLCAKRFAPREAWAILEDMASVGIVPDKSAFHNVLQVTLFLPSSW